MCFTPKYSFVFICIIFCFVYIFSLIVNSINILFGFSSYEFTISNLTANCFESQYKTISNQTEIKIEKSMEYVKHFGYLSLVGDYVLCYRAVINDMVCTSTHFFILYFISITPIRRHI